MAKTFPQHIALTCGSQNKTYAEVAAAASQAAGNLRERGVQPGDLVAICLERSIDMIVAMLGVLAAGAAYLPIDPSSPPARIEETLLDATPVCVIVDDSRTHLFTGSVKVYSVRALLAASVAGPLLTSPSTVPADLAYVIYTSGSTGKPKGVMVSHANVLRLLDQTVCWFHFDEHDVWTMFHSFAFDFSVWEIWGCLLNGGRLVIVPYAVSRSPEEFYALLADEKVTVLNQTPTAFNLLSAADAVSPSRKLALRVVILGGEALALGSLQGWFSRHGDRAPRIVNMYGITETTVHVTYRRISSSDAARETESVIGEPIADLELHLLDETLRPVTEGEIGEICVGGEGVALGYLNRPELTAERFIADPFSSIAGAKLYRSGDLGRRRKDGELVYLGRADRQLKIAGFRIEPGEIEAVLAMHPGVGQVCVIAVDTATGKALAAYFSGTATSETLRRYAVTALPAHMHPGFYTHVEQMPLNINGKVDRSALPNPVHASTVVPDGASLEQKIAAIWARVLGVERAGLDDNFFDAGGTSLRLIALRAELQQALGRTIPLTLLFESATVRTLAARLQGMPGAGVSDSSTRTQQQRSSLAAMRLSKERRRASDKVVS